ncbi:cystathionine gamma-synthase [Agromyces flavus]|uniref:homocysteine desulfhydrase n=1 Tax=Agromyces flavus TaxID=589382 RepID=A0A1H1YRL2_9MICO|nr:PLP-dependent aspartate aminotransferase family protein [Agromyces flavus]MCP2366775.1 cystathionine gamma-synthase [Agromyces flavus]GGI45345.1 cystathionine gamma-synthase [Agromyces flavus]SDT23746.1 cystathionine gamma-synthase [Agromyces flavus]
MTAAHEPSVDRETDDQHSGLHPDTLAVHVGRPSRDPDGPMSTPVHLASTYHAGGPAAYGRYGNPSWEAFEAALGALEGGRCVSFASGMAAISAVLDLVPTGGTVVAPRHSYTGTIGLLDDLAASRDATVRLVDVTETGAVTDAAAGADLVWIESPTNPALEVADLPAIGRAARAAGALFAVDNTFATPLLQRPLDDGADLVVHSATKSISGHSDVIMGAVIARDEALRDRVEGRRRLHGAIPGPMESFLALRGLRTLPVRLERAQATAQALVDRLAGNPALDELRYPGFGAIISIVVAGGADAAERVAEATRVWVHSTSLGGVESQLERRRRWAAEAATIPEGLIRLSVGLEHVDDLARDLEQALATAAARSAAG